jgi:hypothetical protein
MIYEGDTGFIQTSRAMYEALAAKPVSEQPGRAQLTSTVARSLARSADKARPAGPRPLTVDR